MRYLSAYQKSHIPMMTQLGSTALHVFWCHLFVVRLNLGVTGASIAICITYTSNFIALVLYTCLFDRVESRIWTINRQAFKDFASYLKLGVPGTLMIMMDIWCYEIITLQAGYLKVEATAAQIILSNVQVFSNQVPLGFSIAASSLIGGAIGEANIFKAKSYIKLIFSIGASLFVVLQILMQLMKT
jgi:Na+-driven multidrug efflux pump